MNSSSIRKGFVRSHAFILITAGVATLAGGYAILQTYQRDYVDDIMQGRLLLTLEHNVDSRTKVEEILQKHNYSLIPGQDILWDLEKYNNISFHFSRPDKLNQQDMITLLRKVKAAPFITETSIDDELRIIPSYPAQRDEQHAYESLFQRWYGGEYVNRINAQNLDVKFTNSNREDFAKALASYEPRLTVLPGSLAATPNSWARVMYGNKEGVETLEKILADESGVVNTISVAHRDSEIRIQFPIKSPLNPISYIPAAYPLLKYGPNVESESDSLNTNWPSVHILIDVTPGNEMKVVKNISDHPEEYRGIAYASPVYKHPLPRNPSNITKLVTVDGTSFVAQVLVVITEDNLVNEEMVIRNVAKETHGEIVGQVADLGVYEIYYSDAKKPEDLVALKEKVKKMRGVKSVSLNFVFGLP